MKLIGSLASPYVRKVRVVMAEKKLDYHLVLEDVWAPDTTILQSNPLGKVPCLLMEDGGAMFDSRVIVNVPIGGYGDLNAEEEAWFVEFREQQFYGVPFAILKAVAVMKGAGEIRAQIVATLHGWPMLLSGAWLFVDDGRWRHVLPDEEPFRRIEDSTEFKSFLHGYFHLQFNRGQD
ncbi:MAG: glutathione S-transferase N-terminal domain-containing protein, partial [Pseudomonadota bacterium]